MPQLDSAAPRRRRSDMTGDISTPWRLLRIAVGAIYLFMLGPILITAAVSFNASPDPTPRNTRFG